MSAIIEMPEAPIATIDRSQVAALAVRIRSTVPDSGKMSDEQILTIAHESLLYRTMPAVDMHYWVDKQGRLQKSPDYKYLKNMANYREQLLSGDDTATIEDKYTVLNDRQKTDHGVPDHCIAVECVITTERERKSFFEEVERWVGLGAEFKDAVVLTKETYGEIGDRAVGVVDPTEKDRWGKPVTPPGGWSFQQWAKKLALKNAINLKYGQPTPDEKAAMAYRMAKRAMPQDWENVLPDQPAEVQAYLADLEATARESVEQSEASTPEERNERRRTNNELLYGPTDEDDAKAIEGEARPVEPYLATTPNDLLEHLQEKTDYYNKSGIPHIFNAIRKHLGDDNYQWPQPEDVEGWNLACVAALEHAEGSLAVTEAEQPELFPQAVTNGGAAYAD